MPDDVIKLREIILSPQQELRNEELRDTKDVLNSGIARGAITAIVLFTMQSALYFFIPGPDRPPMLNSYEVISIIVVILLVFFVSRQESKLTRVEEEKQRLADQAQSCTLHDALLQAHALDLERVCTDAQQYCSTSHDRRLVHEIRYAGIMHLVGLEQVGVQSNQTFSDILNRAREIRDEVAQAHARKAITDA